ncbi:MAG: NINE protein [Pauljensenia sp.]
MTTPDPQVTPSFSEDPTKAAASDATPGASAAPGMPANNATADIPAPQVPGPDAPSFPQASAPDFDESMATPGTTTYGTAYDSPSAGDANGAQAGYDQAAYGAQASYGQAYAGPPKQWIIAVLLAFFLGTLGIHNFYLGYTTRGIIQLVLTLTFIGAIVSAVWAFIEFILILMRSGSYAYDAQGRPLE